jgi:hypothetical protein
LDVAPDSAANEEFYVAPDAAAAAELFDGPADAAEDFAVANEDVDEAPENSSNEAAVADVDDEISNFSDGTFDR